MNADELPLVGLDGANPLGFLAALGALRSLALAWPDRRVRMAWVQDGAWRPFLRVDPPASRPEVVRALDERLRRMHDHPAWALGPNPSVPPETFRHYAARAARQGHEPGHDRSWADFAAAFGCESTTTADGKLTQDTALRTMSGAGHQNFLEFIGIIVGRTTAEHVEKALFHPWRYDDPVEKQSMRWDPSEDVRRAHQWRDPSGDPRRKRRGGMLGANRLAIEGLPLLPTIPVGEELHTTGFTGRGGSTLWIWPIWTDPLSTDVVRSLLAHPGLVQPSGRAILKSVGVAEVFQSRRLTIDKFRCFTPGEPTPTLGKEIRHAPSLEPRVRADAPQPEGRSARS
jgi:hypothetical protein